MKHEWGEWGKSLAYTVVETKTDHFHSPLGSLLNWFNLTDGWCEKCRLQELSSEANLQYQLRWLNKIILHDTATQRSSFLGNLPHLFLGLYLTLRVQTSIGSNGGKVLITSKFTWVTSHKICGGMKRQCVFWLMVRNLHYILTCQ